MSKIRLNWSKIHYTASHGLHELLNKYDQIFQEGLATFKGYKARIKMDPNAIPHFCKARTVPYAMREVELELSRRLLQLGSSNCGGGEE